MTNEQNQVKQWMIAFGQETPDKPTIPSLEVRKLRAKLIFEEALETINALGLVADVSSSVLDGSILYTFHETPEGPNLCLIADGCEDLKVVTEGTLVACGLVRKNAEVKPKNFQGIIDQCQKRDPLFDEVMRSNWSKMWTEPEIDDTVIATHQVKCLDGKSGRHIVKDANGKVIKSPSYSPANLQPIIDEMSK